GNSLQAVQLRRGKGCLQLAHAVIGGQPVGQKFRDGAVGPFVTKAMQDWPKSFVIARYDAAVATGNVLRRLQRKTSDMPDCPDGLPLVKGSPRLCAIFNENQLMFVRQRFQLRQLRWVAPEMHCDD